MTNLARKGTVLAVLGNCHFLHTFCDISLRALVAVCEACIDFSQGEYGASTNI